MERPPTSAAPKAAGPAAPRQAGAWPGSALKGRYELKTVLASGGSCLVYLAWDHEAAQSVVVKEFRPDALVQVDAQGQVLSRSPETAPAFERGLRAFVKEARALQQCDHPSLVRVLDVVEANGTAYQVMPRYRGGLFMDVRRKMPGPMGEPALRDWLVALLGAVDAFHQHGGVHGGIHPAQILMLEDDRPLLLGPGAAGRAVPAPPLHPLARPLQDGYAPPEQSHPRAHLPQGPWTDCFAVAAVARYAIAGPLEPAAGLAVNEPLAALVRRLPKSQPLPPYSEAFLGTLDAALSADMTRRPQSAREFRERLQRATPSWMPLAAAESRPRPLAAHAAIGGALPHRPATNHLASSSPTAARPAESPVPGPHKSPSTVAPPAASPLPRPEQRASPQPMPQADAWRADPADRMGLAPPRRSRTDRSRSTWWARPVFGVGVLVVAAMGYGVWHLQHRPLDVAAILRAAPPAAGTAAGATPGTTPGTTPGAPAAAETEATAGPAAKPQSPVTPPSRVAAQPAAPTGLAAPMPASSPRQECGSRTNFALYRCMQLQCERTRWSQHPQCLRFAETDSVE